MLIYSCLKSTKPLHMSVFSNQSVAFQFNEKTTTAQVLTSDQLMKILRVFKVICKDGMVDYNLHVFHLERSRGTSNLTKQVMKVSSFH